MLNILLETLNLNFHTVSQVGFSHIQYEKTEGNGKYLAYDYTGNKWSRIRTLLHLAPSLALDCLLISNQKKRPRFKSSLHLQLNLVERAEVCLYTELQNHKDVNLQTLSGRLLPEEFALLMQWMGSVTLPRGVETLVEAS